MFTTIGSMFQVNTFTQGNQGDPAVAIAPDGSFVVVWTSEGQNGGRIRDVFGQRFNADGTPAGPEFQVNVTTDGHQRNSDVAMDAQGNFAVVWEGAGVGDGDGTFARRFDREGNVLGVSPAAAGADYAGEVVEDIVEETVEGVLGGIFGNRAPRLPRNPTPDPVSGAGDIATTIQGEFRVNNTLEGRQDEPAIAMDSRGNFVITWTHKSRRSSHWDVFARTFDETGNLLNPEFRVHAENPETQKDPAVAMNDQGNILFAWASMGQEANTTQDSYGIFARHYTMEGPIGQEFQVNETTANAQVNPQVFIDQQGNSSLVWEYVGSPNFFTSYLPAQSSPSFEFRVEALGVAPRAATDGYGNTVVTIVTGSQVEAHQIQIPQQTILQNTTIFDRTADVGSADLALNESGDGVIVWVIEDEDGSGNGVFAQRFTTMPQTTLEPVDPMTQSMVAPLDATSLILLGASVVGSLLRWARNR
jgi:hypothetical protein